MREVIHGWTDGYGAELRFTRLLPALPAKEEYAYVTFASDEHADVFATARDLRAIAAAALAMAEVLDAAE